MADVVDTIRRMLAEEQRALIPVVGVDAYDWGAVQLWAPRCSECDQTWVIDARWEVLRSNSIYIRMSCHGAMTVVRYDRDIAMALAEPVGMVSRLYLPPVRMCRVPPPEEDRPQ